MRRHLATSKKNQCRRNRNRQLLTALPPANWMIHSDKISRRRCDSSRTAKTKRRNIITNTEAEVEADRLTLSSPPIARKNCPATSRMNTIRRRLPKPMIRKLKFHFSKRNRPFATIPRKRNLRIAKISFRKVLF